MGKDFECGAHSLLEDTILSHGRLRKTIRNTTQDSQQPPKEDTQLTQYTVDMF
jgi:hypothetical protein